MSALPVPLVSVSGTPTECGAGYGASAAPRVTANLDLYRRRFRDEAGLLVADIRTAGRWFREVTVALHPRVAAMLDGVAEGAGEPVEDVYALNARTELLYDVGVTAGRTAAWRAGAAGPDGLDGGCTALGVLGTHTASGHLLLGQNWDWHPDQRAAMVLLASRDERGHGVLTLTEAGMLAKVGLNSAGLGVCVNMLGCDRDGLPAGVVPRAEGQLDQSVERAGASPVPGLPYHVLLRIALESDSLSWALRNLCRAPRNASVNLLLGQAPGRGSADPAGGEMIDLELVPGDAAWLHPVDGVLSHANHLESALPVHDIIKDWGGSSPFRSARARRLIAGAAAARKVAEDDLASVLRDHASYPLSICRHLDEREAPAERSESVYSVLLDLDAGRLALAAGPPCGHPYTWMALADVVA